MPRVAILTTGNEILDGRVLDTNTHFLLSTLHAHQIEVVQTASCTDSIELLQRSLRFLLDEGDVVIISGGLGPTTDDLTREAVAGFAQLPLFRDEEVIRKLETSARERKRILNPTNLRQADRPVGAELIPNPTGTAPGFALPFPPSADGMASKLIIALPGIPSELRQMTADSVLPLLRRRFGITKVPQQIYFKVFGLAESEVGGRIEKLNLPAQIGVAYRVQFPEVHVVCTAETFPSDLRESFRQAIGVGNIFSELSDGTLEEVVRDRLRSSGSTLAIAESCTGGVLGGMCTNPPGASAVFVGGVISYANSLKESLLNVSADSLRAHGAVSHQTARAMANGVRHRLGSSHGVSITGVAGPDGGSSEKPVGKFFVGVSTSSETQSFEYFYPSTRQRVRVYAAYTALDVLRRLLLGIPLRNETPR